MKKNILILTAFLSFLWGCQQQVSEKKPQEEKNPKDQIILSLYWYRYSPEKKAIYLQNFNLAKEIVKKHLAEKKEGEKLAVITDIDETVLDNSGFEVELLKNNQEYSYELWKQWTDKAIAEAQPGAVEFSQFLKENNVELFYISNRRIQELNSTIKNLKEKGFAFADTNHVFLQTNTKDKTLRRQKVFENYKVILLLGDNLRDFDEIFKNNADSLIYVYKEKFGTEYIVFPNPMYGDWLKLKDSTLTYKSIILDDL